MTVILPTLPGPVDQTWEPVLFGGRLQGPLGGPATRVLRLGDRFRVTFQLPPMHTDDARMWLAALARGQREGVLWHIRQPGVDIGLPGSPVVDGDDQAGSVLSVTGAQPNYAFKQGLWLNVWHDAIAYLHLKSGSGVLNASGAGEIPIEPPLRIEPSDGDLVEIGKPVIMGSLSNEGVPWTLDAARHVGLSVTIEEDE